jgi:heme-degrading monooxygenase HmoA
MIMRMWHGTTPSDRAAEYLALMTPRALADYRGTPGNRGAWVLTRRAGDTTHVTTLSLWHDMESIQAFAGERPELARYYAFDAAYLTTMEPHVLHWDCDSG